uniref:PknH-like extracellular domain-containing protein n=1 Tax=Streptomyces sp. NBC_00049 TaxID=2903617 RepID=A0AAU2JRW4_9ACTN
MSRTAAPRRVRTAVLASAGVLAAATVYGLAQHAAATDAPPSPATGSAASADGAPAPGAPAAGAAESAPAGQTPPAQPPAGATPGPSATAGKGADKGAAKGTAKSADKGAKGAKGGGVVVAALEAERVEPAQLPDNAQQKWKELAPAVTQPLAQDFQLNECVSVPGATHWRQQGFISSHKTPAIQNALSFKDEAAAKSAYQKVVDGMNSCAQTSQTLQKQYGLTPDAAVRQTATIDNGRAWSRRWNGVQGASAAGAQTNHIYVVQRGAVLTLLTFDEWDSAAPASYDPRSDASVLTMLAG